MFLQTMTWEHLPQFFEKSIVLFGTDKPAVDLINHIKTKQYPIVIKYVIDCCTNYTAFMGYELFSVQEAIDTHKLDDEIVLIASNNPMGSLNQCIDSNPQEIWLCSRGTHAMFTPQGLTLHEHKACKRVLPFYMQRGTPQVRSLVLNAGIHYEPQKNIESSIFEIADFQRQEYVTWTTPIPSVPLDLKAFSEAVDVHALPMRMSHLNYLLWKRSVHVVQMSYSRRYILGVHYNYFHLDILDTHTGILTQWHDLPPEKGLWDYVATGDFDDHEESFYFVRWPLKDAIQGMADGTNKVHCQVGKLNLSTMKAEILHEFEFQDRIHQCTISGDGHYMVFAPMRVLRPEGDPKKIKQEDLMRNLQKTVVLDSMLTLDLKTGKTWRTQIPFPIPAHFELDPFDPHLLYVSTHSLMPHADGVLCFQPGTLHKLRIKDGETIIEGTYTHPKFVRTTQHCVFVHKKKVLIAATNQNRLEIIDAESMSLWHCYKLADDPLYDNANFDDPEFLNKPFNLPPNPAHCNSISASADGRHLVLKMADRFKLFDIEAREVVGDVLFHSTDPSSTHSRYYMQNAPQALLERNYANMWE